MKLSIHVTHEIADEILLEQLKSQYEDCFYQDPILNDDDKKYVKRIRKALKRVLKHNMTPDEQLAYFK